MNSYLEEAAALLRKASEDNERQNRGYPDLLNAGRMEIADKYAALGAIEAGVIPAALLSELLDRLPEVRREAQG